MELSNGVDILATRDPWQIFSTDFYECKKKYRQLASVWHPDLSTGNQDVFLHINRLYDWALEMIQNGDLRELTTHRLHTNTHGVITWDRLSQFDFELGKCTIGLKSVGYESRRNDDLFNNAITRTASFAYSSTRMARDISRYLPVVKRSGSTPEGQFIEYTKPQHYVLLADAMNYEGGALKNPGHLGWILNSLYNLCCYLNYIGICHGNISPYTVFVSAEKHAVWLSGWWYAVKKGEAFKAASHRCLEWFPERDKPRGSTRIDLELVKAVGRYLLGDESGENLHLNKSIPKGFIDYLNEPAGDDAVEEYRNWQKNILPSVYGDPKWVDWDATPENVYKLISKRR